MAKKDKKKKKKDKDKDVGVKVSNLVVGEDKEFSLPEDSEWYAAKFEEAETSKGRFGELVFLKFKLLNGELENGDSAKNTNAQAMTNAVMSPSSQLMKFYLGLNGGEEVEEGDTVDLTAFYGDKFDVLIKHSKENKEGKVYANIDKIKEYKHKDKKPKKKGKKKK